MDLHVGLDPDRLRRLVAAMTDRGITVATAESLTGGLLGAVLTEIPGSSVVFRGGMVVYATELKTALAGVDPDLLARSGPVDAEVATHLARGARNRCGATFGVGLTGVAGPDPQDGLPPGTFHVALVGGATGSGGDLVLQSAGDPAAVPSDREAVRSWVRGAAVVAAVALLEGAIGGAPGTAERPAGNTGRP